MPVVDLFGDEIQGTHGPMLSSKYTTKIAGPIYEPKNQKPSILELRTRSKYRELLLEIDNSHIREDEKEFLREAATRHIVFDYSKIADFYAHSSPDVQRMMEKSALVIIDFDRSLEYGYTKLSETITEQLSSSACSS